MLCVCVDVRDRKLRKSGWVENVRLVWFEEMRSFVL